jgi:HAD superfamily hydrolase (TIGR01450 family)
VAARPCWIIDLDGVIYAGEHALGGAVAAVAALRHSGRRVAFLTNNSRGQCEQVRQKLIGLGIPCAAAELLNSARATARYVRDQRLGAADRGGVFVIGMTGLRQELVEHGAALGEPATCAAVVVGIDQDFTYDKLGHGLRALGRGVPFVACNRDANFPGKDGLLLPGCGAIVAALETAAQRPPTYEVGKPNPLMLDLLLAGLQLTRADCVMVGDSLEADIAMAERAGVPSIWISQSDLPRDAHSPLQTTLRASSLAEAVAAILPGVLIPSPCG